MRIELIPKDMINDISSDLLDKNGKMKLYPSDKFKKHDWYSFRVFCLEHARYGIHTLEQQLFLQELINGKKTIEIGAGAGDLGFHMKIPMTDLKLQNRPEIKVEYEEMRQPTIKYPDDVEEIEAMDSVHKYKPEVVIASWVTTYAPHEMPYGSNPYGIQEDILLDHVDMYILIGNINTHGDKPIMKKSHEEIYENWMVSRAKDQLKNRIWIWRK